MKPEIFDGACWSVETAHGTALYPCDYFTMHDLCCIGAFNPEEIEKLSGYFARLSMPGYLDCTDWCGPFKTEAEARAYLTDTYGDDNGEVA